MSTEREGLEDGCVKGVYGDMLRVGKGWKNPSGKWRVGTRRVFELYPAGLVARMKEERRKKLAVLHQQLVAEAAVERAAGEEGGGEATEAKAEEQRKWREELVARRELLNGLLKDFDDAGPSVECVVWHDGERWMAAVDTRQLYRFYHVEGEEGEEGEDAGAGARPQSAYSVYGEFIGDDDEFEIEEFVDYLELRRRETDELNNLELEAWLLGVIRSRAASLQEAQALLTETQKQYLAAAFR